MTERGQLVWNCGRFELVSTDAMTGGVRLILSIADKLSRAGNDCK